MNRIKQKFVKLITFFIFLSPISSCKIHYNFTRNSFFKDTVAVAILIPISEKDKMLYKEYVELIKMGFSDNAKVKIKLTVYEYSNKSNFEEAIRQILKKRVKIIIGPINSEDTKMLANALRDKDIAVFSFSNDPSLANDNIFVLGHAPLKQIEKIITYLTNNEYKHYILLLPNNRRAQNFSEKVKSIITSKEGIVNKIESYNNTEEDMEKAVSLVAEIVSHLNEQDEILKKPVIVLGDNSENLEKIYKFIKELNLDKKAVVTGDNKLDIKCTEELELLYTGSSFLEKSNLKQRANDKNIEHFSFMHAIAYDAGKIIASNLTSNYTKEIFIKKVNKISNFLGSSGKISFKDFIAYREYDILKKEKNKT